MFEVHRRGGYLALDQLHRQAQSAIFQSPCACAAERLKRRPKPWIKKTFGGSSQNRYTFSICATLPSISSVNLVHFRFVVHFTDLCKSKNDGPDRQRKHHNCKKGPETPKITLTKKHQLNVPANWRANVGKALRAAPPETKAKKTTH